MSFDGDLRVLYNGDLRILHKDDLRTLLTSAAEEGGENVLKVLGLDNKEKIEDLKGALQLAAAFRSAKSTALQHIIKLVVTGFFAAALIGAAVKLKLWSGS